HREKTGLLTKALADSREITLSDYYLKRPETGVKEHYLELGHAVHFTENHIWTGLFGLLFWDELFVSEKAAIFNPFERSPLDLANNCFYEKHKIQIENKLKSLGDLKAIRLELLKTVSQH